MTSGGGGVFWIVAERVARVCSEQKLSTRLRALLVGSALVLVVGFPHAIELNLLTTAIAAHIIYDHCVKNKKNWKLSFF